jgi:hypothetical protein
LVKVVKWKAKMGNNVDRIMVLNDNRTACSGLNNVVWFVEDDVRRQP